jgi:hypothetical protein
VREQRPAELAEIVDSRRRSPPFDRHPQITAARDGPHTPQGASREAADHEHAAAAREPAHRVKPVVIGDDQPLARDGLAAGHRRSYSPSP